MTLFILNIIKVCFTNVAVAISKVHIVTDFTCAFVSNINKGSFKKLNTVTNNNVYPYLKKSEQNRRSSLVNIRGPPI